MNSTLPLTKLEQELREMNEALLLSSVKQHELAEQAQKAEAAMRESEHRYRIIVDQVKDYAIFSTDTKGRATTWNQGVKRILGFEADEFIGKDITNRIFTLEDINNGVPKQELDEAAKTGTFRNDRRMLRKNGKAFFAAGVTTALRNEDGQLIGFTKVIRDQTEKEALEAAMQASEIRYRRLFESANDGLLILNARTGKITDANARMGDLMGTASHELLGKELWEIGLFKDKSENEAAFRQLQEHGYVRYDHLRLKTKSGQQTEVELVSNVYHVDDRHVAQCNIRDISERSRLERKTQEQAEALADLDRRKDEFLAMLSHELRNPLAPIMNAVQLLRLNRDESELQQRARAIIERQLGQLVHLVDDLLEVSRISTGRIHLQRELLDLRAIVESGVESVRPLIDQRRDKLAVRLSHSPIWIDGDSTRLEQVVVNLLNNAAKYTDQGGHIWLSLEQKGSEAVLKVRDSGVGIAPELMPRIFDLFTQADQTLARAQGGLGIGLCLVHRLVELHGGKITAHSALGQGSEFVVRLPIMPNPAAPGPSTSTPAVQPTTSLRVLVVDDNVDAAESLAMLLKASGNDVRTEHDGPTAVEAALDYRPEVVLLDIGMPGLNGFEVANLLRQQPTLRNTIVVAMTGYGQEGDRQRSKEAGFHHYFVKPVPIEQLQKFLEMATENRIQ